MWQRQQPKSSISSILLTLRDPKDPLTRDVKKVEEAFGNQSRLIERTCNIFDNIMILQSAIFSTNEILMVATRQYNEAKTNGEKVREKHNQSIKENEEKKLAGYESNLRKMEDLVCKFVAAYNNAQNLAEPKASLDKLPIIVWSFLCREMSSENYNIYSAQAIYARKDGKEKEAEREAEEKLSKDQQVKVKLKQRELAERLSQDAALKEKEEAAKAREIKSDQPPGGPSISQVAEPHISNPPGGLALATIAEKEIQKKEEQERESAKLLQEKREQQQRVELERQKEQEEREQQERVELQRQKEQAEREQQERVELQRQKEQAEREQQQLAELQRQKEQAEREQQQLAEQLQRQIEQAERERQQRAEQLQRQKAQEEERQRQQLAEQLQRQIEQAESERQQCAKLPSEDKMGNSTTYLDVELKSDSKDTISYNTFEKIINSYSSTSLLACCIFSCLGISSIRSGTMRGLLALLNDDRKPDISREQIELAIAQEKKNKNDESNQSYKHRLNLFSKNSIEKCNGTGTDRVLHALNLEFNKPRW